ncbi:MAG TPA: hypothetical protein VK427_09660 [Kofleriaceae bacterium]|nr:hypothetical protein [Kofleriaceae bacterium]
MKIWKLAGSLCLAASTATAQPTDEPAPATEPAPAPTSEPAPTPAPAYVAPAPPVAIAPASDTRRPEGFSVGIGFGYILPSSLETPNTTSARFRLASALTFEPVVRFQQATQTVDVGMSTENKETTLEIGALGRIPLRSRGKVDLVFLGGLFVENISTMPDAENMDRSLTTFEARYGIAVEYWLSRHWQISMSALNTVFRTQRASEEMGPGTETVVTQTSFGAIYDPVISAMVHLYY